MKLFPLRLFGWRLHVYLVRDEAVVIKNLTEEQVQNFKATWEKYLKGEVVAGRMSVNAARASLNELEQEPKKRKYASGSDRPDP